MEIFDLFASADREHWMSQLRKCDWGAGRFLCQLIDEDRFRALTGEWSELLLLTDGDRLVSFCTFCGMDEIDNTELSPWVGFVYTFPEYRGRRCFGRLLEKAKSLAAEAGFDAIYISTDHIGLYEKYGFEYIGDLKNRWGDDCRVYRSDVR